MDSFGVEGGGFPVMQGDGDASGEDFLDFVRRLAGAAMMASGPSCSGASERSSRRTDPDWSSTGRRVS